MITCCLNCQDRQVGCHSSCARYICEKELHERERAKMAVIRNGACAATEILARGARKAQRRHGYK